MHNSIRSSIRKQYVTHVMDVPIMQAHSRTYLFFAVALLAGISFGVCFDGSSLVGQWATEDSWIESIINSQEIFRIDPGIVVPLMLHVTPMVRIYTCVSSNS